MVNGLTLIDFYFIFYYVLCFILSPLILAMISIKDFIEVLCFGVILLVEDVREMKRRIKASGTMLMLRDCDALEISKNRSQQVLQNYDEIQYPQ